MLHVEIMIHVYQFNYTVFVISFNINFLGFLKLSTGQVTLSYINQTICLDVTFLNDDDDDGSTSQNFIIQLSHTWMLDQEYTVNFQQKSITIIIIDEGACICDPYTEFSLSLSLFSFISIILSSICLFSFISLVYWVYVSLSKI